MNASWEKQLTAWKKNTPNNAEKNNLNRLEMQSRFLTI